MYFLPLMPHHGGLACVAMVYFRASQHYYLIFCSICAGSPLSKRPGLLPRTTDKKLGFFDDCTMSFGSHSIRRLRTLGTHEDASSPSGLLRIQSRSVQITQFDLSINEDARSFMYQAPTQPCTARQAEGLRRIQMLGTRHWSVWMKRR